MCQLQAGDETEELEGGKESEDRLPDSLASVASAFPGRTSGIGRWDRGLDEEGSTWQDCTSRNEREGKCAVFRHQGC